MDDLDDVRMTWMDDLCFVMQVTRDKFVKNYSLKK